jgi:hypothetical protein
MSFQKSVFVSVLMALLQAGCGGSSLKLENVAGTATFDGRPIVFGQLEFIPDSSKEHQAPAGEAEIVDGKFDTSAGGKGIVPGPYKVRVTAYEARPESSADETVAAKNKPPLFQGYTIDMDVQGGELTVAVPADANGFSIYNNSPAPRGNFP